MMQRQLSLTTVGLSLQEELLVKSLLLIVNARTRDNWHFREDLESDVALCDPQSALTMLAQKHAQRCGVPCCISLVHEGLAPIVGTSALAAPIRSADFIALLNAISGSLSSHRGARSGSEAATTTAAPKPAGSGLGLALLQLLKTGSEQVHRFDLDGIRLHVIPATRALLLSEPLTEHALGRLLESSATLRPQALDAEEGRRVIAESCGKPLPLDGLLWRAGIDRPQAALLPSLPAEGRFRLRRWPDFGRLKHQQFHFRMAALMTRAGYTMAELASASGQPADEARAFINACALCDLIEIERATASAPVVTRIGASPGRYAGIFRSIRSALGFLNPSH